MNKTVRNLLDRMSDLEEELRTALHEQEKHVLYQIKGKTIEFEQELRLKHRKLKVGLFRWFRRSELRNVVSAPFIYAMLIPLVFLDLYLTIYQHVCFRLYRIPRVPRSTFIVIDRHHLEYLNTLEKVNCVFCGYANGLLAYAREVGARTEQYWCPIKHARKLLGMHCRYTHFTDFGEAENYHARLQELRSSLAREEDTDSAEGN